MTLNWIILAVVVPALISAARIQLIDISPEEAQKLITQQSLDLTYAKKLGEGSASGRSYNGKIIDSDDYTEEIYEANQFHGQDGLGRAIFGYTDNQQTRLEARNANGEVRGQYQYIDPWGKDIQVQYWVDSLGFHQTDNHPQYDNIPVTETPEVKEARAQHEKLWKAAARLNGVDDSNGFYNSNVERLENDNYDDEEPQGQVSNQHQSLARYPVLPYSQHIAPDNAKTFGKVVGDSVIVDTNEEHSRFARQQRDEIEEVTSEPRGFFYSFDYPVPFIVEKNARVRRGPAEAASERVEDIVDIRFGQDASQRASDSDIYSVNSNDDEIIAQNNPQQKSLQEEPEIVEKSQKEEDSSDLKASKNGKAKAAALETSPKEKPNRGRGSIKFHKEAN